MQFIRKSALVVGRINWEEYEYSYPLIRNVNKQGEIHPEKAMLRVRFFQVMAILSILICVYGLVTMTWSRHGVVFSVEGPVQGPFVIMLLLMIGAAIYLLFSTFRQIEAIKNVTYVKYYRCQQCSYYWKIPRNALGQNTVILSRAGQD